MYPDVFILPRNYSSYIDIFIYKINGCYIPRWLICNLTRPPQLFNPIRAGGGSYMTPPCSFLSLIFARIDIKS